ncbi:PHD finger and CXXC domaincontaining protein CG17446like, partial [Caligus rogercresseyi]
KSNSKESDDDDLWMPSEAPPKKPQFKDSSKSSRPANNNKKSSSSKNAVNSGAKAGVKRRRRSNSESSLEESVMTSYGASLRDPNRQCLANCTNTLALDPNTVRINAGLIWHPFEYSNLPDRIREWNLTPCLAEKNNLKELESIHAKQVKIVWKFVEFVQS